MQRTIYSRLILFLLIFLILTLSACTLSNQQNQGVLQEINSDNEISVLALDGKTVTAQVDSNTIFENNGEKCSSTDLPPGSMVTLVTSNGRAVSVKEYKDIDNDEPDLNPPPPSNIDGAQLYSRYCAGCHNDKPPIFWRTSRSATQLANAINSGSGIMPGFAGVLTTAQINAIVQFIQNTPQSSTTTTTTTTTSSISSHNNLTWQGPTTCLACHESNAREMFSAVHYQWKGQTPDVVNGPDIQGKDAGAFNAFCINILGNWSGCGSCHPGLGARPETTMTQAQLANIDCLICHQKDYIRVKVGDTFVPDTAVMTISLDQAVRTVHLPERSNCLLCHARSGGADAFKRGDLTLAHANTADSNFDVHMAVTGANRKCIDCHNWENHRVPGRGADLRPSDLNTVPMCTDCHSDKVTGHSNPDINRHTNKLACQTCHIPVYAKNAADTVATEATETHRTWSQSHYSGVRYEPVVTLANNLIPAYRFWNKTSWVYNINDIASISQDTGLYAISRPLGAIDDPNSKLYPFKYKTAEQPMTSASNKLIALDTSVFFATGNSLQAISAGLINMGMPATEAFTWVTTDEFLMLNHEVMPAEQALTCNQCHGTTTQMDLAELGYILKGPQSSICTQCHDNESIPDFFKLHNEHRSEGVTCSSCHSFNR